ERKHEAAPEAAAGAEEGLPRHLDRHRQKPELPGELGVQLAGGRSALAQTSSTKPEEGEADERVEHERGAPAAGQHQLGEHEREQQQVEGPKTALPREPVERGLREADGVRRIARVVDRPSPANRARYPAPAPAIKQIGSASPPLE